ncbi:hypothetical protein SprV_0301228400 [Sparganum proliferum]
MTSSDEAKTKFYEDLHAPLTTVLKTDKLVVLASTTTTALTADAQNPHSPPPSIAAISIISTTTSVATTATTTERNSHDGPSTTTFTIVTPDSSDLDSVPTCPYRDRTVTSRIGLVGRCLGTRINEHKLAIRRRDPLSLVFAHALEYDHRFNWDGTEVVAMANTKRAREFLEAWYSDAGSINRHVDLDAHYEGLRSRMTAPCPNHASTTANTAARIPTDSPPALPLQHGVP